MSKYFYYTANGEKMGPVPGSAIKLLAQNGIITPETRIEDERGKGDLAKNIKGLTVSSTPSVSTTDNNYQTLNSTSDSTYGNSNNAEPLSAGMILGGKYRLESLAGRGGMGVVWKAFDKTGERWVALKFVPKEIQRFEHEMKQVKETFKTIHNLNHQYICPVYALEEDSTYGYYQVMKWLDGIPLDDYLKRRKGEKISPENIRTILRCVAEGLDYAHQHGVIHRDVKPSNIFIRLENGQVVEAGLIDFGLATAIRETLTRVSQMKFSTSGTRPYMPPEQWRGRKQDAKTDQYSLAVVAYELYAGNLPFWVSDTEMLGFAILNNTPEQIKGIPDFVNDALQKALSKDREDRFENCIEFVKALTDQSERKPISQKPSVLSSIPEAPPKSEITRIISEKRKVFIPIGILLMIFAVFAMGRIIKESISKSSAISVSPVTEQENISEPPVAANTPEVIQGNILEQSVTEQKNISDNPPSQSQDQQKKNAPLTREDRWYSEDQSPKQIDFMLYQDIASLMQIPDEKNKNKSKKEHRLEPTLDTFVLMDRGELFPVIRVAVLIQKNGVVRVYVKKTNNIEKFPNLEETNRMQSYLAEGGYFYVTNRGETIRLLFPYGNVAFQETSSNSSESRHDCWDFSISGARYNRARRYMEFSSSKNYGQIASWFLEREQNLPAIIFFEVMADSQNALPDLSIDLSAGKETRTLRIDGNHRQDRNIFFEVKWTEKQNQDTKTILNQFPINNYATMGWTFPIPEDFAVKVDKVRYTLRAYESNFSLTYMDLYGDFTLRPSMKKKKNSSQWSGVVPPKEFDDNFNSSAAPIPTSKEISN